MNGMIWYYIQASSYIWPNRAADLSKAHILEETFRLFCHLWSGSKEQNWYLDIVGIYPVWRRQIVIPGSHLGESTASYYGDSAGCYS
jgi:hypothetical protein